MFHTQFKMAKTKISSYKFPKCIRESSSPKIHQNHISPLKNSLFLLEPFLNPSSAHRLRFTPNNLIAQQHPQTTSNTPKIKPNHLTTDHPLPTSLPSWRSSNSVFPADFTQIVNSWWYTSNDDTLSPCKNIRIFILYCG